MTINSLTAFAASHPPSPPRRDGPFTHIPTAWKHYLASTDAPGALPLEWSLGSETAILSPRHGNSDLDYGHIHAEQSGIALNILDGRIRATLSSDSRLWRESADEFNEKMPITGSPREGVSSHRRFRFRLHLLNGQVYLSLSPTLRYMSRESLQHRLIAGCVLDELMSGPLCLQIRTSLV